MSQKQKCCILKCSARNNTKLFRFPTNNNLRAIWRQIIRPYNPHLYRSSEGNLDVLAQRNVCERHFELRYIRHSKRENISIPTLFTQEEIASRTPTHPIELKMENLNPPWVLDTSTNDEVKQLALSLMIMSLRHDHNYYLTKRFFLESSLALEQPVSEELTAVPTSGNFDVEQIGQLGTSDRVPAPVRIRYSRKATTSDGRSAARRINTQQPSSEIHTPPITASGICPAPVQTRHRRKATTSRQVNTQQPSSDTRTPPITASGICPGPLHHFPKPQWPHMERFNLWKAVLPPDMQARGDDYFQHDFSLPSKLLTRNTFPTLNLENTPADHIYARKRHYDHSYARATPRPLGISQQTASSSGAGNSNVSDELNQTVVSEHCENQPVVNINIEDAVDDFQYLAGLDTYTGTEHDCYNISDDDCQAVVDDDSSFYDNVSKQSDDKDGMEVEPQNLDKNEDLHDGFKCNFCSGEIKGYRYTCVQCPDYDLCGSCEARGAHCLHYVLRIPRPKPYAEIQPLLCEIKRLLSGADTEVVWTQLDEIKEESDDDVDPLDIDCVTPTLSETEDIVPEISTRTSITKTHGDSQSDNKASTYTLHKQTVTVDKICAASTSSPYPESTILNASNRNTLLTIESDTQASGKSRTPASKSSQYTASTRLAPDGNTVLTIESKPQIIENIRIPVSASSPYPVLAKLARKRNTLLTMESSLQAIDNTRIPASEPSLFTASTSVSSDDNTGLTIATNVEDTDSASRPVPSTSRLYASSSVTPGDTETIYNKISITEDSHLQVPTGSKRKCSENIEASKYKVMLLKGSHKWILLEDGT